MVSVQSRSKNLYKVFLDVDSLQLAETPQGMVYTVDVKLGFDDNASFRQKAIFDMDDTTEFEPREVDAASHNLNHVQPDGNIGCLANGTWTPARLSLAQVPAMARLAGAPQGLHVDVVGELVFTKLSEDWFDLEVG